MSRAPQNVSRAATGRPDLLRGVELVIFDFDGVVVDSELISLSTLRDALAECGVQMTPDQVRDAFLGKSKASIFDVLKAQNAHIEPQEFSNLWESKLFARFRADLKAIPHIETALDALEARGIAYCIASSGTAARIGIALEAVALEHRFSKIFSAEQVARGKPAPDLFLLASERLGVPAANCLVIEDSLFGAEAAQSAKMRCIAFVGGSHLVNVKDRHSQAMRKLGAESAVEDFSALI